jgi:hypothetical protein
VASSLFPIPYSLLAIRFSSQNTAADAAVSDASAAAF